MKATFLFLFALVAVNSLTLTKKQHMDVLAQINQHPLGEAILSQLSLHMSAQGYLSDVVDMIQGLLNELADAQADTDGVHNNFVAMCNRLLPEYENNMNMHTASAASCDKTVADTQDLLADAEDQLSTTLAELDSVNARIAAGQAQRDMEHAAWVGLDAEHEAGINACQDAVNLLSSMGRGALFIQLQGRINKVTKQLEQMTHLNDKFTAYAPLVNSFSQIASSANNPELLAQITGLINTLKGQITATREADAGWEERKATAWAHELADLTNQKNSLTERKNNLESAIENYHNIISENQEKSRFHKDEAEKFAFLLSEQTTACNQEMIAYTKETTGRDQERDILGRLKDYISSRTSTTEEFIMMRQTTY